VRKYQLVPDLAGLVAQDVYERWLHRKAVAHVRRDRARGNTTATNESYKRAIHSAVNASAGRDFYTGEMLDWSLVSTYDNEKSKLDRRAYKAGLALLPTVDHLNDGTGEADFVICSWRSNDAKNDMSIDDFVALCRKVVSFADGRVPG
jgi:hypothetical protein